MSVDYTLACEDCEKSIHIGQVFSFGWTFGYGRYHRKGEIQIGEFIERHTCHTVKLCRMVDVPQSYQEEQLCSIPDTDEVSALTQRLKDLEREWK